MINKITIIGLSFSNIINKREPDIFNFNWIIGLANHRTQFDLLTFHETNGFGGHYIVFVVLQFDS